MINSSVLSKSPHIFYYFQPCVVEIMWTKPHWARDSNRIVAELFLA